MIRKKSMPIPVTLNDCLLLYQMGYEIEINNGKVTGIKKSALKEQSKG